MKKPPSRYSTLAITLCMSLSQAAIAKDIYVAPTGDDAGAGSFSSPYQTLAKAAQTAQAGDVVYLREGTYQETLRPANSGTASHPIVFQSYQNEKVIISAMEALSGWQQDTSNIYKTTVNWDLGQENFVMHKSTALDLARWPNNTDADPFTLNSKRNTGGSGPEVGQGAYIEYAAGLPNINWTGGTVFYYGDKPGGGWLAWRETIVSHTQTRINIDLSKKNPAWVRTAHDPASGGEFYLMGVKGALDYQNEWYFDSNTRELFVQLPNGARPQNGDIQFRKRLQTINLANRSHIHIKNIAVFGGAIEITNNANSNLLSGVSSFYGNATLGVHTGFSAPSYSVKIQGSDNRIENSEIAYGSGTGIYDSGTRSQIVNNYIHDFNTLGDYNAPVNARGGSNTLVKNNRISRGGRDTIQAFNRDSEWSYNDVSHSNLIADDCGLFYTVGGPHNVEIHHNWFHDAYSHGNKNKAAGIYLDNDARGFKVHHNVVWNTEWTGIQINWNGTDIDVFNNTLWNNSAAMGAWHKAGTAFSDVRVWNNLSNSNKWEEQANKQNNLTGTGDPFVNSQAGDFRLKANTAPIDYGRTIAGTTEGHSGANPDAGAYEYGATAWKAGVTWDITKGAANRCYQLPGEVCFDDTDTGGDIGELPGKVEAENYAHYYDTTPGNIGGAYRNQDVDIQPTTDTLGGYNVGWINAGEWLEYDIDVTQAGRYDAELRVASKLGAGQVAIAIDGVARGEALTIQSTGDWQNWATLTTQLGYLEAGLHTLRVSAMSGGFNLNWYNFTKQVSFGETAVGFTNTPPTRIPATRHQSFSVDYVANEPRELFLLFFNPDWSWVASTKTTVEPGKASTTLQLNLPFVPTAVQAFNVKLENRPIGANWDNPNNVEAHAAVTTQAAPLQHNGGFENGGTSGWNGYGSHALSTEAHSGSYAGKVTGGPSAFSQTIPNLTPNTTYSLSAFVKARAGHTGFLGVKEYGGQETSLIVNSTHYQKKTITFTTGPNASSAKIYLYVRDNNHVAFIDELVIVKVY
ncbi:carbohydrate-binding protein [Saccharophagus degradans]|uniref:Putative polysaccharide-binding protein n=1 Tax=Saccharophagus degradans (strain 2-40 / ATCC 43961 / DSM 17024) TaxID=203122 RepID=Q21PK3_SACD2|nr:carbohydrate-binding protein [Saccharophagus degradans]ABD79376.1 putative polysaccharide-binding protein [Saccharophagus degradans 2-40]